MAKSLGRADPEEPGMGHRSGCRGLLHGGFAERGLRPGTCVCVCVYAQVRVLYFFFFFLFFVFERERAIKRRNVSRTAILCRPPTTSS